MQKFNTIGDAIALAEFAHRKQVDKSGQEYIGHPLRVLARVQAQGALPYVQMAAVLHDSTEDTAFTPQMLLELGIPESAVQIVKLLDRECSRLNYEYCTRWQFNENIKELAGAKSAEEYYYFKIRDNPGAKLVKLADIEDNLSPWRLAYLEEATQERLQRKYAKARELLS